MNATLKSIYAFLQTDSHVWWALAQASLIAAVAYLLVVVARRISPACRVQISLLGLLLMALIPVVTLAQLNAWSWGQWFPDSVKQLSTAPLQPSKPSETDSQSAPQALTPWEKLLVQTSAVFKESPPTPPIASTGIQDSPIQTSDDDAFSLLPLLVITSFVFCIGFGLTRLAAGYLQIRSLRSSASTIKDGRLLKELAVTQRKLGLSVDIPVRETDRLGSAAVVGWIRPILLLPQNWQSWTTEERQAVLAHELAHIKRRDFLSTEIGQMAVAFNFYHPLAHVVLQRLRLDQELAADSLAASITGGHQRYVELLAGLALRQPKVRTPGPCLAFLPPRRMFVRRLEMLRSLPQYHHWLNRGYSTLAILALLGVATLATGLRPQAVLGQEFTQNVAASPAAADSDDRPITDYLPAGLFEAVALIDAQGVRNSPGYQAVAKQAELPEELSLPGQTITVEDVEQVLIGFPKLMRQHGPLVLVRSKRAFENHKSVPQTRLIDSRTLAISDDAQIMPLLGLGNGDAKWRSLLNKNAEAHIRIASDTNWLRDLASQDQGGLSMSIAPLWKDVRTITAGIVLGNDLDLKAQLDTSDPTKTTETLTALKWLARNYLENLPGTMRANEPAQIVLASTVANAGSQVLDSLEIGETGQQVQIEAMLPDSVYPIIAISMPAVSAARSAAQRTQSMNNMKQIMLALHNYHDAYRHLPPAVVVDRDSGEKRSWRVELLPFLERADLYEQYRKDEPWDSPANLRVMAQMPRTFAVPGATNTQDTPYQAIVSDRGGLTLTKTGDAPGFKDFLDGTSNTAVIVETKLQVPWTKPVDLVADQNTPRLGTVRESEAGIIVGMGDGSVQFLHENIDASIWQALITRDGGEVVGAGR